MNRKNSRILAWLLAVPAVLSACGSTPADPGVVGGLPGGTLSIGEPEKISMEVEIASTAPAQAKGLMNVKEVPDDYGLVFIWPEPGVHSFYMKNTLIPLDIAWWDEDGKIVDIQTMTPCRQDPCPVYDPAAEHIAAVEVKAGLLSSSEVRVGDSVRLRRSSPPAP